MRYKVGKLEIRSENTVKPISQASKVLTSYLEDIEGICHGLDYGCGKLRYSGTLASICQKVTLVDSKIQTERIQLVNGTQTTIKDYAEETWTNARVLAVDDFRKCNIKYDFALCANVLSAIPIATDRDGLIKSIYDSLKVGAIALFVTQYRNSYFNEARKSPNAQDHLDGWILTTQKGNFYYGIINKSKLTELLIAQGFSIEKAWTDNGVAYVRAKR